MLALEMAWKSTALLVAAGFVAWLLRARPAALRHFLWTLTFAGLLALPLLSVVLPALRLPLSQRIAFPSLVFRADAVAAPVAGVQMIPSKLQVRASAVDWRMVWMAVWAGGAALSLAQISMGWWALSRMRRRAVVFGAPEDGVALLENAAGSMPMTYGWLRPVIFLPANARAWNTERLRMVILHELAHVKRGDGGWHVLVRLALSVYWWNPLAWWAWRKFLAEQERAADDLVLRGGACGSAYAGHLLEIARSMQVARRGWPVVAMASGSQLEARRAQSRAAGRMREPLTRAASACPFCASSLERRLEAILDAGRDRRGLRRGSVMALTAAAICFMLPLAAMQAPALLQAGDEARERGKYQDAKAAYDQFLRGRSSGKETATAYIHRGTVEMAAKDYQSAISDFKMAQASDMGSLSEALMWEAIAEHKLKNEADAGKAFEASLRAADPQALQTSVVMEIYSQFLTSQGRAEEAKAMLDQSAVVRKAAAANDMVSQKMDQEYATGTGLFTVGGGTSAPVLLHKVEPEYSADARAAGYSGVVALRVVVGTDGTVHDVRIVRPLGLGLDQKAIEAVQKWTFKPAMRDGKPVNVYATIEVNFRLL
jgi:TonB family protein